MYVQTKTTFLLKKNSNPKTKEPVELNVFFHYKIQRTNQSIHRAACYLLDK